MNCFGVSFPNISASPIKGDRFPVDKNEGETHKHGMEIKFLLRSILKSNTKINGFNWESAATNANSYPPAYPNTQFNKQKNIDAANTFCKQ